MNPSSGNGRISLAAYRASGCRRPAPIRPIQSLGAIVASVSWAAAWDGTCFTTVRQWVCDIEIRGWCPETPPPPDSACRRSTRSAYGRLGVSSDGTPWTDLAAKSPLSDPLGGGRYWRSDESREFSRSTGREEQRSRQHQVARDGRASRRLRQDESIPGILSGRAGKRNQAHLGGQRLKIGQKN